MSIDDSRFMYVIVHSFLYTQGYKHQKAYIIAQNPLQSTVRNFWKVIYDRKCAVVVMLSRLREKGEVQDFIVRSMS